MAVEARMPGLPLQLWDGSGVQWLEQWGRGGSAGTWPTSGLGVLLPAPSRARSGRETEAQSGAVTRGHQPRNPGVRGGAALPAQAAVVCRGLVTGLELWGG